MVEYTKQWLSIDEQVDKLAGRGVDVGDRDEAGSLLQAIGYYRLTGYLYPFRNSEVYDDPDLGRRTRVFSDYRAGTSLQHVARVIEFDRCLRLLVLEGVERIEVALRMRIGYVIGQRGAFAHLQPRTFTPGFTTSDIVEFGMPPQSRHQEWLERVEGRRRGSDEAFVRHFRDKYDDRMPIWALTEILELGQLGRLYRGLNGSLASSIAASYGVPTKKILSSWIASVNYVRNVAAHHARLFNRKLVSAPSRPQIGVVPLLDHLRREQDTPKTVFGLYNALAVTAYLLRSIDPDCGWADRVVDLVEAFPAGSGLTVESMGMSEEWSDNDLWRSAA